MSLQVCERVCICMPLVYRSDRTTIKSCFFVPLPTLCEFWGSNSGCQTCVARTYPRSYLASPCWGALSSKCVLVRVTFAVLKHHDQKRLGERVPLAYTSTTLFIIRGGLHRNSGRAGTWWQELMSPQGVLLIGFLSLLFLEPRTTFPGVALPTTDWGFSISITS